MRKNNLWITALAFGLSLSAYGQQAEGGISSGMLQEIKQAYKGTLCHIGVYMQFPRSF